VRVTILLTAVAMVAFAANSLLARLALASGSMDAAPFTVIRLASGAFVMTALLLWQRGRQAARDRPGNWSSAAALLAYALGFSLAYLRLGAATGALILFAAVQGTMISWGMVKRDHPTSVEIVGLAIAFAAFVYLLLPGLDTPDLGGTLLMVAAGIAWGIYSLRGRTARDPLDETAGNFVRAAAMSLPLLVLPIAHGRVSGAGIGLAIASGAIASGLGYAIWYRALRGLSTTQAATVQLTVPMIAAAGAVVFLAEPLTARLVLASVCILGGVALAILARRRVRA
jgi:drug/metabolite transporter (DMT)-like permease